MGKWGRTLWTITSVLITMAETRAAGAVESGPGARVNVGVATGRIPADYHFTAFSPGATTLVDLGTREPTTAMTVGTQLGWALQFRPAIGIFPHLVADYTLPHGFKRNITTGLGEYRLKGDQSVLIIGVGNEVRLVEGRLLLNLELGASRIQRWFDVTGSGQNAHTSGNSGEAWGRFSIATRLFGLAKFDLGLSLFGELFAFGAGSRAGLQLFGNFDGGHS